MKKIFPLLFLIILFISCGNDKPTKEQKEKAERYIYSLTQYSIDNIYAGTLTDANILVLAVDAYPGANFDVFAQTYLEKALNRGLDIEGVAIVSINDCQIGDGWVKGKRIGRAFK
jgi:hypothetical protein